jgi:hypothetical protein
LCLVISKCPLEDRRRRKKEVSFRLAPACREVLFNVRECVISDVCNQISFRFLSRLFLWILFPPWSSLLGLFSFTKTFIFSSFKYNVGHSKIRMLWLLNLCAIFIVFVS